MILTICSKDFCCFELMYMYCTFAVAPKVSPNFIPRDITVKKGEEFKIVIPYDGNPIPKADWTVVSHASDINFQGICTFEKVTTEERLKLLLVLTSQLFFSIGWKTSVTGWSCEF